MSDRPRPSRVGFLALLTALVGLVAAYLNGCLVGLGLSANAIRKQTAAETAKPTAQADARVRVVVQGEQCRLDGRGPLQACDTWCAEQAPGTAVEIEATAGAQRAVEGLRTCLQGRGIKAQVVSE
ncbi:hypothetical protein [Nannocystis punicea]|uniref:Uncharacterized protein n=1 Tax=Nannocystis punicea TaxID=2995304 RepID=A0ABY7HDH7_9BACT|nr:hypothetical protein [Nannocystis poenicansa]WAS97173.1 hypothetical protein O0S08_13580 [Nannocystis poenicansa]